MYDSTLNEFIQTKPDGSRNYFNPEGECVEMDDPAGNAIRVAWTAGKISMVDKVTLDEKGPTQQQDNSYEHRNCTITAPTVPTAMQTM